MLQQRNKTRIGEVSKVTLTNILIHFLLFVREKADPNLQDTLGICAIGFVLLLLEPSSNSYFLLHPNSFSFFSLCPLIS